MTARSWCRLGPAALVLTLVAGCAATERMFEDIKGDKPRASYSAPPAALGRLQAGTRVEFSRAAGQAVPDLDELRAAVHQSFDQHVRMTGRFELREQGSPYTLELLVMNVTDSHALPHDAKADRVFEAQVSVSLERSESADGPDYSKTVMKWGKRKVAAVEAEAVAADDATAAMAVTREVELAVQLAVERALDEINRSIDERHAAATAPAEDA